MRPTNKISVLADGEQWGGSHDADLYLVSDKVLEDLQGGLKPYKIESDYKEGIDWIKKAPSILNAGNVCDEVQAICKVCDGSESDIDDERAPCRYCMN
jgi:hypothetical protein